MNGVFGRIMSFINPPAPQVQPMQQGQSVSSYPGYQKPISPPAQVNFQGLGNAISNLGHSVYSILAPTPKPSAAPKMSTQQAVQQMQNNGWNVVQPSASPVAQIMAMAHPQPTQAPQSMGPAQVPQGQFKFQMGQHQYPQAPQQLGHMLGNAPLAQYIPLFVKAGEKYGVDPRVLAMLALKESSGGRNYPTDSNNPFGYTPPNPQLPGGGKAADRLRYAGFTSIPHAIDALTGRFQRQPTTGYQQFYQQPTLDNLQAAYNSNPAEKDEYIRQLYALAQNAQ